MKLKFVSIIDPAGLKGRYKAGWDIALRNFDSAFTVTVPIVEKYLSTKMPSLPNPFRRFTTNIRMNQEVYVIATADAEKWIREGFSKLVRNARRVDQGELKGLDAITMQAGLRYPGGEHRMVVFIVFDLARLLESALKVHGDVRQGFYTVAVAAIVHELGGHLPSILKGEEMGDRRLLEVRAFTRSVAMLEWWIAEMRRVGTKVVPADTMKRFERVLSRERQLLRHWKK